MRRAGIPADATVLVRGEDGDHDATRRHAHAFLARFAHWGRYGLSAYHARNEAEIDDLASDQLERFPLLGIYRIDSLREAGFDVVPTFRTPHVTIAFRGDVDDGIDRLLAARSELRPNPYHGSEPDEGSS
jgi:hypothetical protein